MQPDLCYGAKADRTKNGRRDDSLMFLNEEERIGRRFVLNI
jgi:hypothetical protein